MFLVSVITFLGVIAGLYQDLWKPLFSEDIAEQAIVPGGVAETPTESNEHNGVPPTRYQTTEHDIVPVQHQSRIYLTMRPREMLEKVKALTDIQASLFEEATFEDKWIRIRGPIRNVMGSSTYATLVIYVDDVCVRVRMKDEFVPNVTHLQEGDHVTVDGKFRLMDRIGPDFEEGELVSPLTKALADEDTSSSDSATEREPPSVRSAGVLDEPAPFDVTLADGATVRVAPHLNYSLVDKLLFLESVGGHHKIGRSLDPLTQKVSIRVLEQVQYSELRRRRAELEESAKMDISKVTVEKGYKISTFTFGPLPRINENQAEQSGADQPATAPESNPEGNSKPEPESEVRPQ